jgi:ABC-type dipeptide/oligopeptide/nickel transport system permease subunit
MRSVQLPIALSVYAKDVSLFQVGVMISIFSWPFAAKTIRSQVLSLRSRPYVDLARPNAPDHHASHSMTTKAALSPP